MALGRVAMAIEDLGSGVWEVSKKDEVATYAGRTGMGVLIFNSDERLWVTHWIDLGSGDVHTVRFADAISAIMTIEGHDRRQTP